MDEGLVLLGIVALVIVGGMWSEFVDYLRERDRRKDGRQD